MDKNDQLNFVSVSYIFLATKRIQNVQQKKMKLKIKLDCRIEDNMINMEKKETFNIDA